MFGWEGSGRRMKWAEILGWVLLHVGLIAGLFGIFGLIALSQTGMERVSKTAYEVGIACRCGDIAYEHNPYRIKCQVDCWNKGWKEAKCE